MPCYNVTSTIDETMGSLINQTYEDFEIVLVDDGSTDETPGKLKAWAARDGRVRVISREHEGIIPALNAGLGDCRAPFVARMDADDRCHPERLQKQVDMLEADPGLAVCASLVEGFPIEQVRA